MSIPEFSDFAPHTAEFQFPEKDDVNLFIASLSENEYDFSSDISLRDPVSVLWENKSDQQSKGLERTGSVEHISDKPASRFTINFVLVMLAVLLPILAGYWTFHNALGYSWFHVVSSSMQSVIPEGSLVIIKRVDPDKIRIGDIITYRRKDGRTVTHQTIHIIENFGGSEFRGFVTKGVENAVPDEYIVPAGNVLGVVVFHSSGVGRVLSSSRYFLLATSVILLGIVLLFIFWKQKGIYDDRFANRAETFPTLTDSIDSHLSRLFGDEPEQANDKPIQNSVLSSLEELFPQLADTGPVTEELDDLPFTIND